MYYHAIKYYPLLLKRLKHMEGNLYPNELAYMYIIRDHNSSTGRPCTYRVLKKISANSMKSVKKFCDGLVGKGLISIDQRKVNANNLITLTVLGSEKLREYEEFFRALYNGWYDFEEHKIVSAP